jgi:cytidylate kinase
VRQTTETILKLAELGNVIVIGRAGSVITSKSPNVLHVRLVAPLQRRIERLKSVGFTESKAREFIKTSDHGRVRYLKKYFKTDINDPLLYDLVINTDRVPDDLAARLIGDALLARMKGIKEPSHT